jgi:Zn-dependent oligopeptidase
VVLSRYLSVNNIAHFPDEYNSSYHQLTLVNADNRFQTITSALTFYQNVSLTKELRDASNDADSQIRDFAIESDMRLDVFKAKMAAKENAKTSGQWDKLSAEQQRLVDKMVGLFFPSGFQSIFKSECDF